MTADIIAKDQEGRDILLVEVKASVLSENAISQILKMASATTPSIPYAMVVGLNEISVVRPDDSGSKVKSLRLDSKEILGHYDPEYGHKRIFDYYLKALVEAWLNDLAYHWDSDSPPGSKGLAEIGLLERLEGGTLSDVPIASDSLC